jgi:N-glycosylase/DNA lyase
MTGDLSRNFGNQVSIEGRSLWTFPEAYVLANISERELRDLGLGFRAPNILEAAQRFTNGVVNKSVLQQMTYTEALSELMKFRGIGPKIAACVLLFSIDKKEAFPVDRWVRRSLKRVYGLSEKLSQSVIEEWAQNRFGQNAGYAQQFLFHSEWTAAKK